MPPRTSPLKDATIATLLEVGTSIPNIGLIVGVSESKVRKVRNYLRDFGSTKAPQLVPIGRTPLITPGMTKALRELLHIRPSLYVDEMVWFCYDEFHVMVNKITVRRWLSINRYTRKKLQRKAAERNLMV